MKRLIISLFVVVLALAILVLPAIAAAPQGGFVDVNQDGICDNRGTCPNTGRENPNGNCGNPGNFSDADNDGICDNKPVDNSRKQRGCNGQGYGRQRKGCVSNGSADM